MAEKYPTLPDRKQEVLSIELARWKQEDGRERAVVVTTERRHLSVFVDRDDGSWASFQRPHRALDRMPTSPAGTSRLRWSCQVAIQSDATTLVVAYKRRLAAGTGLWIDRFHLDPMAGGTLVPLDPDPLRVPIEDLGLDRTGFWLRGAFLEGRLFLVTQGVAADGSANLVLLMPGDSQLGDIDASTPWHLFELDGGGYDLDAVQQDARLEIVHRRQPGYVTVPRQGMPTSDAAFLVDDPVVPIPQLGDMLTPLVRVTVDLASPSDATIDDTLPPVEHPQILSVEPFLVVGDRLLIGLLGSDPTGDGERIYDFRTLQSDKIVIRRHQSAWVLDDLFPTQPDLVPRHLFRLLGCQQLLGRSEETFELGTLLPQHPVALLAYQADERREVLVLAHEHRQTGTLVATTFHLSLQVEPPGLVASSQGFAVLDIGREQLGDVLGMPDEAENAQFEPLHARGPHDHADGFRIRGPRFYKNTMGGAVVGPPEGGAELYAYVDMGDAGLRVFHETDASAPPPVAPPWIKALEPGMVTGPGGEAHAWIDIVESADFDPRVPAYRAPYADFVRAFEDPQTGAIDFQLVLLLLLVGANRLVGDYLEPPSLLGSLQPSVDLLPLAVSLTGGWDIANDGLPLAAEELVLSEADTVGVQEFMSDTSGRIETEGPGGAAFALTLHQQPSVAFPGTEVSLRAETGAGDHVFTWTLETVDEDGEVQTEAAEGAAIAWAWDEPGTYRVTLVATSDTGQSVTIERRVVVGVSLWDTLWATFDTVDDSDVFGISALTLTLLHYRLEYELDGGGARDGVRITWQEGVPASARFLGGGITQGRVDYGLVIGFEASSIQLEGPLALAVEVRSVRGSYRYGRPFSPSVLTSDRRQDDVVQGRPFPAPVETVQRGVDAGGGSRRPTPEAAALAMKPVGPSSLSLREVEVRTALAPPARVVGWLIGVLAALGLAAVAAVAIVGALVAAGVLVVVGIALAALVGLLIVLGLTWLLVEVVAPPLLQWAAQRMVRSNLEESLAEVRTSLDGQGLATYTGEGLAEGLAGQVIAEAQAQGFDVEDPGRSGRDRHRHAFFETIFVSNGLCRVRVRVPPGA